MIGLSFGQMTGKIRQGRSHIHKNCIKPTRSLDLSFQFCRKNASDCVVTLISGIKEMVPEAWLYRDVFVASTSDILPRNAIFLSNSSRSLGDFPGKDVYLDCQHRVADVLDIKSRGKWCGE